ncbi:MAG TPA: glycoside hydrolase family 3 C-terminal domain-containing protein [Terrimicrobium sp.]
MNDDFSLRAKELVNRMTLEEKAILLTGNGWWATHPIDRLGVPSISITDGPHGVRKSQGAGLSTSVPATCFPTASALSCSWDADLVREVGVALGEESQAINVHILLGPGINMKRSPLGGRNFEYFSEDPVLAGRLAAAYIEGVQSQGVGTSLKHYAVNNQEFERMATSSNVDERTLHEIYLPAFEIAVRDGKPWTVMSSYNLVNGVYASEHEELLRDILRRNWGFAGFVVSDWGGINDRVAGLKAGTNLEMPGSGRYNANKIIQAVQSGVLSTEQLDEAVTEVLAVILKAHDGHKADVSLDVDAHHALARRAASESIVLLQNVDRLLPLNVNELRRIAIIGAFARLPRYQGSGSSQVNPTKVSNAYDELVKIAGNDQKFVYAVGYNSEGEVTERLLDEARKAAVRAEVAIVFAGLPDSYESEGFDRASLDMPLGHKQLIEAVASVQPSVAVVLMNGSAVTMPWADRVKAIVEAWLGGQAGGGAIADVLTGAVNPSGKLAETFPNSIYDTPTFPHFPARNRHANYGEGIFIGYRHYDTKNLQPLFPFGFGLSYTTFAYTGIRASASSIKDSDDLTVEVSVKNTGPVAGKEVIQLYLREQHPLVLRPEKELRAFQKVALSPGEEKTVTFRLSKRDFAYYDTAVRTWSVRSGDFDILAGGSSRDLPLKATVAVQATDIRYPQLTRTSMLKDFQNHPKGRAFYGELLEATGMEIPSLDEGLSAEAVAEKRKARMAVMAFLDEMIVNKIPAFSEGRFTDQRLDEILREVQ